MKQISETKASTPLQPTLPTMATIGAAQKAELKKGTDLLGFWVRELEIHPDRLTWMDLLQAAADMAGNPLDTKPRDSMMIQMAEVPVTGSPTGMEQRNFIRLVRAAIKDTQQRAKRIGKNDKNGIFYDPRGRFDTLYSLALQAGQHSTSWARVGLALKQDWEQKLFKGFSGALIAVVVRAAGPNDISAKDGLNLARPSAELFVRSNGRRTDGAAEQVFGKAMARWCVSGNALKVMFPARPFTINTVADATLLWGRRAQIVALQKSDRFADVVRLSPAYVALSARNALIHETEARLASTGNSGISSVLRPWICHRHNRWQEGNVKALLRKTLGRQAHLLMSTAVAGLDLTDWIEVPLNDPALEHYGAEMYRRDATANEDDQRSPSNARKAARGREWHVPGALIGRTGGPAPSESEEMAQMAEIRSLLRRVHLGPTPLAQQDPDGYQRALGQIDRLVLQEVAANSGRYFFGKADTPEAQLWVDAFSCIAKEPDERGVWCGKITQNILSAMPVPQISDTPAQKVNGNDRFCWALAFALAAEPRQRLRLAPQLAGVRRYRSADWRHFVHQVTQDLQSLGIAQPDGWMEGIEGVGTGPGTSAADIAGLLKVADDRLAFHLQEIALNLDQEPSGPPHGYLVKGPKSRKL